MAITTTPRDALAHLNDPLRHGQMRLDGSLGIAVYQHDILIPGPDPMFDLLEDGRCRFMRIAHRYHRGPMTKFVYFVGPTRGGFIKIGKAINPVSRLKELQSCCPIRLEILGLMRADHTTERRLHLIFRNYREHGEWFRPEPLLLEYIRTHSQPAEAF